MSSGSQKDSLFLSYRSFEAEFALHLAADLKNAGVNVWMDRLDGIVGGDDWRRTIQRSLDNCAALIAVLSPDYVTSEYCMNELARVNDFKRPIFPLLIRSMEQTQWPLELQRTQFIDFRAWRDADNYRQKFGELLDILQLKLAAQLGNLPDPETRYLNRLIAELEARKGVLAYVELAAQADTSANDSLRPNGGITEGWGLDGVFTLLETSLPDTPRPDADVLPRKQQRTPLDSIRMAIERFPRFVLIGEPGAGKTTTIQRFVLDMARLRQTSPLATSLPLLLYLPRWDEEATPADFVRTQWHAADLPDIDPVPLLVSGDILLFLDGLNEMGARGPKRARQLIDWLQSQSAPQYLVITCRAADYAGDLDVKLPTVLVEEMDITRIRQFAVNYLDDAAAASFLTAVLPLEREDHEDSRRLFRLARNPFLLTALMVVFRNSPSSDLPRNTGALFRRLVMALWEREHLRQTPGWIPFLDMEARFSDLAFSMIQNDLPVEAPIDYALQHLGDKSLLEAGCSASLLEVRTDGVRFYHQLMLEYFAAVGLRRTVPMEQLGPWVKPPSIFYFLGREVGKWDQVIIALSGISLDSNTLVSHIASKDPFLAAQCQASGIGLSEATRRTILEHLVAALADSNPGMRRAAAQALRLGGSAIAADQLVQALHDPDIGVSKMAAEALVTLGELAVPGLKLALHDISSTVRGVAAAGLGQIGATDAVSDLISALQDDNSFVRSAAAEALGIIGATSSVTSLIETLAGDENRWVRRAAAIALGIISNGPAVQGLLETLPKADRDTRGAIVTALKHMTESAIPILRDSALKDAHTVIRENAVMALRDMGTAAVPGLIAVLQEGEVRVSRLAADALDHIGTPEAVAAVEQWRRGQR